MILLRMLFLSVVTMFFQINATEVRPWKDVLTEVKDGCVQIETYSTPFDFDTPFKKGGFTGGSGSGFFVEIHGRICVITNHHVIDKANNIYLKHAGAWQERIELKLVGSCPEFDIALLEFAPGQQAVLEAKLPSKKIKSLTLGNSDSVAMGDEVMVLGYPLGCAELKPSIGEISGHEPNIKFGECFTTTAAVAPGSSGGACVNKQGEVIALTVAMVLESQGYNFLLPISREKVVLSQLKNGKVLPLVDWGLTTIPSTQDMFDYLHADTDGGVFVTAVKKGSLCDSAGVCKGDLIAAVVYDGMRIACDRFGYVAVPWTQSKLTLLDACARIGYGVTFDIELWRNGQKQLVACTKQVVWPSGVVTKKLPFDAEPEYEVFAGCVVCEATENLILEWLAWYCSQVEKRVLPQGLITRIAPVINAMPLESKNEPILAITRTFPTSTLGLSKVLQNADLYFVESVNGIKVRTIAQYRAALLKSRETGFVVIETTTGIVGVMRLEDTLAKEPELAENYGYQLSQTYYALSNANDEVAA